MKHFAEYYTTVTSSTNLNEKVTIPLCGSDSICYLDNRFSTRTMIQRARTIAEAHNRFKDQIVGFTINCGDSLSNAREVVSLLMLKDLRS